jgi:hypothetical protein
MNYGHIYVVMIELGNDPVNKLSILLLFIIDLPYWKILEAFSLVFQKLEQ